MVKSSTVQALSIGAWEHAAKPFLGTMPGQEW